MEKFKTKVLPLSKIKANQQNPRIISESRLKKLINSILAFPRMLSLRPIVIERGAIILGGNMRLTALSRISQMTEEEILERLESLPEYKELPDGGQAVREYWQEFLNRPQAEVVIADDLTEDEKKQFIIKDNVSFGDWDYDELENWDSAKLEDWGVDMMLPDFGGEGSDNWGEKKDGTHTITETEKLSEVRFVDAYYQPKEIPQLNLRDCINTDLFDKKIEFVNSLPLNKQQKEVMRLLAYRFIRIDFEAVANYYEFNASEDEKRAIERLRCVLVDGSLDGFIGDHLLRVHEHFNGAGEPTTLDEVEDNEDEEE